jgi:hypothetical protein
MAQVTMMLFARTVSSASASISIRVIPLCDSIVDQSSERQASHASSNPSQ